MAYRGYYGAARESVMKLEIKRKTRSSRSFESCSGSAWTFPRMVDRRYIRRQ